MRWYASLRRSGEIAYVRRAGRRTMGATLAAHVVADRGPGPWRVAITVSKSVGNAVVRNRVKRRIKGVLDTLVPPPRGARAVFVARPTAAAESYASLASDVRAAVERLRA